MSRLPHFLENRLTDGDEVIPPGRFLVLNSVTGCVHPKAIIWLEGLSKLKNPITSSGMEPATFRLVA
jgi:hypothetical protein